MGHKLRHYASTKTKPEGSLDEFHYSSPIIAHDYTQILNLGLSSTDIHPN